MSSSVLLFRLLGLEFLVRFRAQRLNGFSQTHRLGTRTGGTGRTLSWCLARHVGLHTREADVEILADVRGSNALSHVLEPEQARWAGIPASDCSLLDNLLFFDS